ncbi:Hypothetical protein Nlim_1748 [Candidatus Nitrosarchaeum limnium SFB1]|jgi:hypothetical protein|uniref:Uncharacterized protein n=1 Tax=Candidatus Nitrosarchaeum limnium SFB1 TaxID=886738 RepID=F3KMJ8_9ARCH|nr:Hypothetical protein Nlim_1748 [Candidatus Nitrosarchaeum limnium SFB1]
MQQTQYVQKRYSEATKTLVKRLPVKEDGKFYPEIVSRQNTCAMDLIGLSWVLLECDY